MTPQEAEVHTEQHFAGGDEEQPSAMLSDKQKAPATVRIAENGEAEKAQNEDAPTSSALEEPVPLFAEAETELFSRDSVLEALASSHLKAGSPSPTVTEDPSITQPSDIELAETVELSELDEDSTILFLVQPHSEHSEQPLQDPSITQITPVSCTNK